MPREARVDLIKRIEELKKCRVVTYVCGDRPISGTRIAEDAIRPMYDHLRQLPPYGKGSPRRIALYLYSIGGVMETPWKIVTMLREHCDEFEVIVPYKAYSAATMICLGADKILITDKGELSPIDPALEPAPGPAGSSPFLLRELGVEDVASYLSFLKHRAGLTDQVALSKAIAVLAEHMTPTLLGRVERIYTHIRLVARKLLSLCKPPLDDPRISTIVESLTERTYVHGHGIGRKEAQDMGLQVEPLDGELADVVWSLFQDYEEELRLDSTADPLAYFTGDADEYREENYAGGYIESVELAHAFMAAWSLRRIRKIPAQPVININLSLNMPPNVQANQLQPALQAAVQQLMQQAAQDLQRMVARELARQSPVERLDGGLRGGRWTLVT